MRRASLSLVPPGMYRHFAAVTLALTTALAMFADGENREAQASQVKASKPATKEEAPAFAAPPEAPARSPVPSRWYAGSGFDTAFGRPMESPASRMNSAIVPEELEKIADDHRDDRGPPSQAERELLLRQLSESRPSAPASTGSF